MIIVPKKNLYLPPRRWGEKRFQRGIFGLLQQTGAVPGPQFTVGFSAGTFSVNDINTPPGDARAIIELRSNGDVFANRLVGSDNVIGTWVTGSGFDANDFDFAMDVVSGNFNWAGSDVVNTFINGGATINWGAEETGIGVEAGSGTMRIRPAGGGADIDTATGSCTAESTP